MSRLTRRCKLMLEDRGAACHVAGQPVEVLVVVVIAQFNGTMSLLSYWIPSRLRAAVVALLRVAEPQVAQE